MLSNKFKFNYSFGALANGIKTDTFTFFLLFFYINIVGLEPLLAGLAISIALCVDAVTDPLMGSVSDRTRSRFGRRHPYMFISFIPMTLGYILLFAPSKDFELSQQMLFIWMTLFTILTRLGITLFDIPHRAFGAEITKDYQERTVLMSWRELFYWVAMLGNAFIGYGIFFSSTAEYPKGQLNPEAWFPFALTGAFIMLLSVLYSTYSTRNLGNDLYKANKTITLKKILSQIVIAIKNKSFIVFFFGNLFLSLAWGLSNTLTLFVNTYFWELEATKIQFFLPIYLIGTIFAFFLTPRLVKIFDKRNLVLITLVGVSVTTPAAFIMYNLGLTPPKGTYSLVFFISSFLIFLITFAVIGNMTRDSMVADIADEVELQSGERQEGILYSAVSFMQKLNTAFGSLFAGLVLTLIGFDSTNHTYEQAYSIAFIQGPVTAILLLIPFVFFYNYRLSRQRHNQIIQKINSR